MSRRYPSCAPSTLRTKTPKVILHVPSNPIPIATRHCTLLLSESMPIVILTKAYSLRKVDVETLLKPCSINYTHGHEKPLVSMAALCPGSEYSCIALITPNDLQTGAGAENDSYHKYICPFCVSFHLN